MDPRPAEVRDPNPRARATRRSSRDCAALLAAGLLVLASSARVAAGPCAGACFGGAVEATDVVQGVEVALLRTALDRCPLLDGNRDDAITVDELVEGTGNVVDDCPAGTDKDRNGISDEEECGPVPAACIDGDDDGTPDYADLDDDGDGVLDVNDAARTTPLTEIDPLSDPEPLVASAARLDLEAEGVPPDVGRAGDRLRIEGLGFDPNPSGNLAVFDGEGGPLNVVPLAASETSLTVLVPDGARSPVRVVRGNRISAALPLVVLPRAAPVLFRLRQIDVAPGQALVLRGLDLAEVTEVELTGASAAPSGATASSLEVAVPAAAQTGDVRVRRGDLLSNVALLRITQTVDVEVSIPGGGVQPTDLLATAGMDEGVRFDAAGRARLRTSRTGVDLVTASFFGAETPSPYLQALALPSDDPVRIDATSTAVALIVGATSLLSGGAEAVGAVRTQLEALPAVQALASAIADGLTADQDYLVLPPPSFAADYLAALDAANDILLLAAEAPADASRHAAARGGAAALDSLPATIEPTGGPDCPADLLPSCSEQSDILLRQRAGTGSVSIENDSMVYLSVAIRPQLRGAGVLTHAQHWFDSRIVGTQDGLLGGFNAAERDYDLPNYRTALVEVITGGLAPPNPPAGDLHVNVLLAIRSMVDRVFVPVVTHAVGKALDKRNPSSDAHLLAKVVLNALADNYPDDEQVIQEFLRNRDPKGALGFFAGVLKTDLTNIGPITNAVARWALGAADAAIVRTLGIRIATRLIPVVGAIAAIADAAEAVATASDVVKTLVDLALTPSYLRYDVFFRMTIAEVRPASIERQHEPRVIEIRGFGMLHLPDSLPTVTLVDRGGGPFPLVMTPSTIELLQSDADGRRMMVALESAYTATVLGPIGVTVTRGEEEASAPQDVAVTSGLSVDYITPTRGAPGAAVEVIGSRFATRPDADVRVRFQEYTYTGDPNPLVVNGVDVVVESAELIRVRVPALPTEIAAWQVYVEQGALTRRSTSNRVFFFPFDHVPGPAGVIRLKDVDQPVELAGRTNYWLTPDGNAFASGLFYGIMSGTWSMSGNQLTIEPCIPVGNGSWSRFEGSVDFTRSTEVCCLDGSHGCEPRPCPYVRGTWTLYVRDTPTGSLRQFDYEVDNRIHAGGVPNMMSPRARDGFYPLVSNLDWTCPAQCFEQWSQTSMTVGPHSCRCVSCVP